MWWWWWNGFANQQHSGHTGHNNSTHIRQQLFKLHHVAHLERCRLRACAQQHRRRGHIFVVRLQVGFAVRFQVVVARRQRQHQLVELQNVLRRVLIVGADEQLHQHRFAEFAAHPAQQRFDAERRRFPVRLCDRPAAQLANHVAQRRIAAAAYLHCAVCNGVVGWVEWFFLLYYILTAGCPLSNGA